MQVIARNCASCTPAVWVVAECSILLLLQAATTRLYYARLNGVRCLERVAGRVEGTRSWLAGLAGWFGRGESIRHVVYTSVECVCIAGTSS
jgi:hypothetical protein